MTELARGLGDSTWTRLRRQLELRRIWRHQIAQLQRSLQEAREAVRRLYLEKERGLLLAQKHQREAQDAECIANQKLARCKILLCQIQDQRGFYGTETKKWHATCPQCWWQINRAVEGSGHDPQCELYALLRELP